MRIGIDCRLAGYRHAGIGRYILELVSRLPSLAEASEVEWVLFCFDQAQIQEISEHLAESTKQNVAFVMTPVVHYSLAEQLQLPSIFANQKLDLLHVPHFNLPLLYQGKVVVTIHDLLWHEYRGSHVTTLSPLKYWLKYWAYKLVVGHALRRAATIMVPAETIKKTVAKFYPQVESKIRVTYEGMSKDWLASSAATRQETENFKFLKNQHEIKAPFLVYVGSLYPHKNVDLIVKALRNLPNYQLVLVGSRSAFQDRLRAFVRMVGVESQVKFVGYLPDNQLKYLLQKSVALIQPSLFEGFGLTGIEAMAAGVPVLASDIPIFREIYGQGAMYFFPYRVLHLEVTIKRLTPARRKELIKAGFAQVKRYSWDRMAKETLGVYLES